jgi:lipopolysaccharide transport system ATP-binding protein
MLEYANMSQDNNFAIKAEDISKCYRIGLKDELPDSIGQTIFNFVQSPLKNYRKYRSLYKFNEFTSEKTKNKSSHPNDVIWALKGVSFTIQPGEVVGIIGRNGAGKSTLLKILSKITAPTQGCAEIRGRISSLLEVGTGFHQELTGRENIYLNGSVLGMRKREIDSKFEEIVDFSGVEKFIDTPVKRYSSGMRVRLAFSVAAHLEPEILLIDEVLAVGDAQFQKKCINKMEDVGQQGRTVLFVSHNMPAVTRLCQRVILLQNGRILMDDSSPKVVSTYLHSDKGIATRREWLNLKKAPGNASVRLCAVRVISANCQDPDSFDIRKPIRIEMEYEVLQPDHVMLPYITLTNEEGTKIFSAVDLDPEWRGRCRQCGRYISTAWINGNFLSEGIHFVGAAMKSTARRGRYFYERDAVAFRVIDPLADNTARGDYGGRLAGVVRPELKWITRFHKN